MYQKRSFSRACTLALSLILLIQLFSIPATAQDQTAAGGAAETAAGVLSYEAESPLNTLSGKAGVSACGACSGGQFVNNFWGGSSVQFNEVTAEAAGVYVMAIHYISGDSRTFKISVNGSPGDRYDLPKTADWSTLGVYEIEIELQQGKNTILFSDDNWYSPDLDKIEIKPSAPPGGDGASYEAEALGNRLTGNASINACSACSGGKKVGNLWGGSSLTFPNVTVPKAGVYTLKMSYVSGDPRPISITVNSGEKETLTPPKTADWDTVGSYSLEVMLQEGLNTILFTDDGGWSPDIDKIVLTASDNGNGETGDGSIGDLGAQLESSEINSVTAVKYEHGMTFSNGIYTVSYNTDSGLAAYDWNGKRIATGIYSSADLGGTLLHSKDYTEHRIRPENITPIQDQQGKGLQVVVEHTKADAPAMKQIYKLYADQTYFLTSQELQSSTSISAKSMAPVVISAKGAVDVGSQTDNRVLVVPFDNDAWSRYQSRTINTSLNTDNYISSEVTAVYDNGSRNGLVIGSVTHDTWKTGIAWSGSDGKLNKLKVYGGFTSQVSTHDTLPHAALTGTVLTSPEIYVGYHTDYRDGMESYGNANAKEAPPLAFKRGVPKGVPVGWNSWGAYDSRLSYDKVVSVSNFFKDFLQDESFSNKGNVYINLDSYWDNMTEDQLQQLVGIIHNNKQKAGIYYGPFVFWGNNMSQVVEGTDGKYTYGDLVLRDGEGRILPTLDGAFALDPTHPGTKQRIDYYFNKFIKLGFEYIKLDFLTHGSLEGEHYDPAVQTGIQAYNQGMAYINQVLDGRMFISASIAPLFPSQYAHARRISCDVNGTLEMTEYQLNNLTYGWWQNGTIYHFTDPDYMHLTKGGSIAAAQSRVSAAAISGTVYLNSDDPEQPEAQQYMKTLLTNPRINELALTGKAFRPVEGNTGTTSADTFVLNNGKEQYVAVFNLTRSAAVKTIDLARAGIALDDKDEITELWSNSPAAVTDGKLTVNLEPAQSVIYKIAKK
ncbi:carbohydrate-binding protein [Paenibacillus gansuensis]|uniref:Carbohydrate-binding protein n=1 Tax=Paenibacillus gansuensis TaxID=306542 RepID=A0ABW5P8P1_9BACL